MPLARASEDGFWQRVKNSPGISKWVGAIIPSILTLLSSECVIRVNENNPDRKHVVFAGKCMRLMSLIGGIHLLRRWIHADFHEWALSVSNTTVSTS